MLTKEKERIKLLLLKKGGGWGQRTRVEREKKKRDNKKRDKIRENNFFALF